MRRLLFFISILGFLTAGSFNNVPFAGRAALAASEWREVTLPAGTVMPVVLETPVSSATSRVEQGVRGHLSRAVLMNGVTVFPRGTSVAGFVTDAQRSGKVKGRAHVAMRFTSIDPPGGDRYRVQTRSIGRTAPATKKADAIKIGAPAAGGAIVGGIIGGKKGALIGSAAGGGAGTAVVLNTRGKETGFARGAVVTLRLTQPLTVRVRD
jgi:hypothetical protein